MNSRITNRYATWGIYLSLVKGKEAQIMGQGGVKAGSFVTTALTFALVFFTLLLQSKMGVAAGVKVPYNNVTHVITCVVGVRAHCASRYLGNTNTT